MSRKIQSIVIILVFLMGIFPMTSSGAEANWLIRNDQFDYADGSGYINQVDGGYWGATSIVPGGGASAVVENGRLKLAPNSTSDNWAAFMTQFQNAPFAGAYATANSPIRVIEYDMEIESAEALTAENFRLQIALATYGGGGIYLTNSESIFQNGPAIADTDFSFAPGQYRAKHYVDFKTGNGTGIVTSTFTNVSTGDGVTYTVSIPEASAGGAPITNVSRLCIALGRNGGTASCLYIDNLRISNPANPPSIDEVTVGGVPLQDGELLAISGNSGEIAFVSDCFYDESTIENIVLKRGSEAVDATVTLSDYNKILLVPSAGLESGYTYTIEIPATVKNSGGVSNSDTISFAFETTGTVTRPAPAIQSVKIGGMAAESGTTVNVDELQSQDILIETGTHIDASTLSGISLTADGQEVPVETSLVGVSVISVKVPMFQRNRNYVLTIPTTVTNVNGESASAELQFMFLTAAVSQESIYDVEQDWQIASENFDDYADGAEYRTQSNDGFKDLPAGITSHVAAGQGANPEIKDRKLSFTGSTEAGNPAGRIKRIVYQFDTKASSANDKTVVTEYDVDFNKYGGVFQTGAANSAGAAFTTFFGNASDANGYNNGAQTTNPTLRFENGNSYHVQSVVKSGTLISNTTTTATNVNGSDAGVFTRSSNDNLNTGYEQFYIEVGTHDQSTVGDGAEYDISIDNFTMYFAQAPELKQVWAGENEFIDNGDTGVHLTSNQFYLMFSNPIDEDTLAGITLTTDAGTVSYSAKVLEEYDYIVEISLQNMSADTEYTFEVTSALKNKIGDSASESSYSFTTEALPEIFIGTPVFESEDASGEAAEGLVANGKVSVTVQVYNNSLASSMPVCLIIALKDEEYGNLSAVSFIEADVLANSNSSLTTELTLPDNVAGQKIFAYCWKSWDTVIPYTKSYEYPAK